MCLLFKPLQRLFLFFGEPGMLNLLHYLPLNRGFRFSKKAA
jgi:hypothetical protein